MDAVEAVDTVHSVVCMDDLNCVVSVLAKTTRHPPPLEASASFVLSPDQLAPGSVAGGPAPGPPPPARPPSAFLGVVSSPAPSPGRGVDAGWVT